MAKDGVNRSQHFVIGGYTIGGNPFDALVFGYYQGKQLMYAAGTHAGFTPTLRVALMKQFQGLEIKECPFANLPESKECRWVKPVLVGEFEFLEWNADEETASHYTRSSNRTPKISDHSSLPSALRPRV